MNATSGHPGQGKDSTTLLKGDAMNAVNEDGADATRREELEDIRQDPYWTLLSYFQECGGMMDASHFSAMAVDGESLVMYDRNNLQCDTALGA